MTSIRVGRIEPGPPGPRLFDPAAERLELVAVGDETPELRTFTFRAERGGRFRFLPGQAMTLALPVGVAPAWRSFTIASPPTRPDALSFTVRAGAPGGATRWLHDQLRPGDRLRAVGPVGRFSLALHPAPRIALISGGSGITPMMSAVRWLADRGERTDIAFVHAARSPDAIPFAAELAGLERTMPALAVSLVPSRVPDGQGWAGERGRLDRALLSRLVPDLARREVFCCGPEGFMAAVRRIALAEGGDPARFHTETFHPTPEEDPLPTADRGGPGIPVTLDGHPFAAREGETVLSAAARAGIVIPTGCRSGLCGTCRLTLLSGEVAMRHAGGLTPRQERAGAILACCSRPRGAVVLRSRG